MAQDVQAPAARSFEACFDEVAPAVAAWIPTRLGRALDDPVDPADVLAEVWLRAREAHERSGPGRAPFRSWIFRVAKNVLLEVSRAAGDARFRGRAEDVRFEPARLPAEAVGVGRRHALAQPVVELLARVERLSDDDRELLAACGLEGTTLPEAARRLGLPRVAAERHWNQLRRRLEEEGVPSVLLGGV